MATARRKVTVGVCGGVAAYKAVELVRALQQAGLDPHVCMTRGAEEFVRPLQFAAISGHRVITSLWTGGEVPSRAEHDALAWPDGPSGQGKPPWSSVEHIGEAQTTGALVVAPATADMLGKMAHGLADDFLSTLYLAMRGPVLVAPAMNAAMWAHPAVQANLQTLRQRGVRMVEPDAGYLACGTTGAGRLAEIASIVSAVGEAVAGIAAEADDLQGQRILITAGGTREPIDGVRFLGNRSSGRMGYALATEAVRRGAEVHLVSAARGLAIPRGVAFYSVDTAAEMRVKVLELLADSTALLMAAAVADFRMAPPPVGTEQTGKLERSGGLTLQLEPTEDIVAEAVQRRKPGTRVLAFAAEMGPNLERARAKMLRKGVDGIVVNDVSIPGLGFDSSRNAGTLLLRDGREIALPEGTKTEMARRILNQLSQNQLSQDQLSQDQLV